MHLGKGAVEPGETDPVGAAFPEHLSDCYVEAVNMHRLTTRAGLCSALWEHNPPLGYIIFIVRFMGFF